MIKIIMDYDEVTHQLYTKDACNNIWSMSLPFDYEEYTGVSDKGKLKQVIKLKEAGFTSEEIIDMVKEGVV